MDWIRPSVRGASSIRPAPLATARARAATAHRRRKLTVINGAAGFAPVVGAPFEDVGGVLMPAARTRRPVEDQQVWVGDRLSALVGA